MIHGADEIDYLPETYEIPEEANAFKSAFKRVKNMLNGVEKTPEEQAIPRRYTFESLRNKSRCRNTGEDKNP
jgi:hypothetical protein